MSGQGDANTLRLIMDCLLAQVRQRDRENEALRRFVNVVRRQASGMPGILDELKELAAAVDGRVGV